MKWLLYADALTSAEDRSLERELEPIKGWSEVDLIRNRVRAVLARAELVKVLYPVDEKADG